MLSIRLNPVTSEQTQTTSEKEILTVKMWENIKFTCGFLWFSHVKISVCGGASFT